MGNQASIQRHIAEEFKRVKVGASPRQLYGAQRLCVQEVTKKKYAKTLSSDYLVLDQVLQMQPFREHPLDIAHLGTLFVLDKVGILLSPGDRLTWACRIRTEDSRSRSLPSLLRCSQAKRPSGRIFRLTFRHFARSACGTRCLSLLFVFGP
jgi:hypothetical protein